MVLGVALLACLDINSGVVVSVFVMSFQTVSSVVVLLVECYSRPAGDGDGVQTACSARLFEVALAGS